MATIWHCVVDSNGNIVTKGPIEGQGTQLLKRLICVVSTGEIEVREVNDLFNLHMLDAHTPTELIKWVAELDEDDDAEAFDALGLHGVSDTPATFLADIQQLISLGVVGNSVTEVSENQTTILVKIA